MDSENGNQHYSNNSKQVNQGSNNYANIHGGGGVGNSNSQQFQQQQQQQQQQLK